jgi:hypothetical protein
VYEILSFLAFLKEKINPGNLKYWVQWHIPIILATWEAEIGKIAA